MSIAERNREAMSSDWQPFTGDYEKRFYEAKHRDGSMAMQHLWPNAGNLYSTDGLGLVIKPSHGLVFRPCTCGHKYGGCTP